MLLTQLATLGLVATAPQSELPGAACGDLCLSREIACRLGRHERVA